MTHADTNPDLSRTPPFSLPSNPNPKNPTSPVREEEKIPQTLILHPRNTLATQN
ncbi:hypothetical protein COCCADRAFT_94922 [Bipolaris zeicola 26-R-13]|uniref:Uncharacterized protein n=1 Tax=Cochliobolus carbonum (strain 26-R-13) TaxID=930089 RepID=W6YEB9_COCC2|nr:uncharacterized protein COCCADRAFT_94922 [Bipolaris zeicola 26-R-13]EUC33844.1 hypothetical protein COCCADRAFT_94922 [Bipolaris zeicola 26-R-13]